MHVSNWFSMLLWLASSKHSFVIVNPRADDDKSLFNISTSVLARTRRSIIAGFPELLSWDVVYSRGCGRKEAERALSLVKVSSSDPQWPCVMVARVFKHRQQLIRFLESSDADSAPRPFGHRSGVIHVYKFSQDEKRASAGSFSD